MPRQARDKHRRKTHQNSRFAQAACEWSGERNRFQRAVPGWVARSDYPEATTLGTKYMDSMYSVFTAEFAFTSAEKGIGVLGELVVGFIYGSLAGVISSIMVTMGVGQQDSMLKLLSLKVRNKQNVFDGARSQRLIYQDRLGTNIQTLETR